MSFSFNASASASASLSAGLNANLSLNLSISTENIVPLTITACEANGSPKSGDENVFKAPINPETLSITRGITYNTETSGANAEAGKTPPNFAGQNHDRMNFDLMFDGTGIIADNNDITAQLSKLDTLLYSFQDNEHRPNIVQITYAGFSFVCKLQSYTLNYSLFKPDGTPIRAKVTLSFLEHPITSPNPRSPDLTHIKTVRIGDQLPLMCKDVYRKIDYYLDIAKVNKLTNFRHLPIETQLSFPPLEK
jgi:hypothetical protein